MDIDSSYVDSRKKRPLALRTFYVLGPRSLETAKLEDKEGSNYYVNY